MPESLLVKKMKLKLGLSAAIINALEKYVKELKHDSEISAANLKWPNLVSVNEAWSAFSMRPYKPGEPKQSFR